MAPRARAIQRKSIHSFSTAAASSIFVLAFALAGACAGGDPSTTTTGDRVFVAEPGMIQIRPGETTSARFVLTSGGVPIAAQSVTFAISDQPGAEAKGAMLLSTSGVTDGSGAVSVDLRAGEATVFYVLATASGAQAELVVVVAVSTGTVLVAPFFAPSSAAPGRTTSIEVLLVDNRRCADIDLPARPLSNRPTAALPSSGGTAQFELVSTTGTSAVVGRALGGRGAVATGCIDLFGSSVVAGGVVQLALPLEDVVPDPVGGYSLSSPIDFVPPLSAAAVIAGPWRDLGDCPLDPAQIFLDCTIDALSITAADPLDCKPNRAAGGEGALGDALAARRGKLIVDFAGDETSCRGALDGVGAPSLDAIVMGLYGSPTPPLVVALPAIGDDAAHVLDRVVLGSTLDVRPATGAGRYVVTHTLARAAFFSSVGNSEVDLAALAIPALTAYTSATARDDLLLLDGHGFSLRLGRAARAGFAGAALAPRLPNEPRPDTGALIAELAALARSSDGADSRCAAIDRAVCAAVGSAPYCTATACPAGLSALVAKLDAVFDAADGTGLDLYLAGSTPLIDTHGDGAAHQLGKDPNDPTVSATWSVDLRTVSGSARLTTSFTGSRTGN